MEAIELVRQIGVVLGLPDLRPEPAITKLLTDGRTRALIERGLRFLHVDNPPWIAVLRGQLTAALASSELEVDPILGEIRGYGVLRSAGFKVVSVPTDDARPTPDFRITTRDGSTLVVDVATRGWDGAEVKAFAAFNEAAVPEPGPGVTFRTHEITPFGAPRVDPETGQRKAGDTVVSNTIQRLCGIKGKETQFGPDDTNLLVLDLARGDGLGLMGVDSTFPLRSFNDTLTNGELFAAFYGRRGMPVYENRPLTWGSGGMEPLGHDGRFRQGSKLSGVLVICRDGVALLENPWARHPLTKGTRRQLLETYFAQLEYCWGAFVDAKELESRIDGGIALLEHFQNLDDV